MRRRSALQRDFPAGVQAGYGLWPAKRWRLQAQWSHTLRAGIYFQYDRLTSNTTSQVLDTDPVTGAPVNDVPVSIVQGNHNGQVIQSGYVQDEWHIAPMLTLNYGLRFDHYQAFSSGSQLSPALNLVWQPLRDTTVHAGYSRYFSPPPFELVGSTSLVQFANTTAAPGVLQDDPVKAERSNYYDFGVEQSLAKGFTLGLDSYFKQATDLVDEGQFGAPIILTPFNYAHGQVYGVELTGSYHVGGLTAYANLASQRAIGKDIVSSQFNFDADELLYIADHYIHLDHEQQVTASAGVSYLWQGTRFSADMLLGSGLRSDLAWLMARSIPNGARLPYYTQVNLGAEHDFERQGLSGLTARIDVINLLDKDVRDPRWHRCRCRAPPVRTAPRAVPRGDAVLTASQTPKLLASRILSNHRRTPRTHMGWHRRRYSGSRSRSAP